jgi:hypothetical protein
VFFARPTHFNTLYDAEIYGKTALHGPWRGWLTTGNGSHQVRLRVSEQLSRKK